MVIDPHYDYPHLVSKGTTLFLPTDLLTIAMDTAHGPRRA